jgi:hypothetical protein
VKLGNLFFLDKGEIMITFLIKNWKEEDLAYRISDILVGGNRPSKTYKKENDSWALGANNWFLNVNSSEGTAKLTYRYAKTPEEWAALKTVIEMVL